MRVQRFDALTRQFGRRSALQALGVAAMATASGLTVADAKNGKNNNGNNKKNKKQKQKIEKKALALCAGQVAQCDAFIASNCGDSAECLAAGQICCDTLATCDFAGLVACLAETNGN